MEDRIYIVIDCSSLPFTELPFFLYLGLRGDPGFIGSPGKEGSVGDPGYPGPKGEKGNPGKYVYVNRRIRFHDIFVHETLCMDTKSAKDAILLL